MITFAQLQKNKLINKINQLIKPDLQKNKLTNKINKTIFAKNK